MQQSTKNKLSREKILDAATLEFAVKGYEGGSLNDICTKNDISKGLIYHYFQGKETLYFECIARSFDKMAAYLEAELISHTENIYEGIQAFMCARSRFFAQNPLEKALFFQTILPTSVKPTERLKRARRALDQYGMRYFAGLLDSAQLRKGITKESALEYLIAFEKMFHISVQNRENTDQKDFADRHEHALESWLCILFYGMIQKEQ